MNTLLVASSKGGVGKTTIATHLAAHAAVAGWRSVLGVADRQGSSMHWVKRRAGSGAEVKVIDGSRRYQRAWAALPEHAQQVVIDAAAGADADSLAFYLEQADAVLAGLGKRLFDYHSAKLHERQSEWQPLLKWLRKHAAPSIPKREPSP